MSDSIQVQRYATTGRINKLIGVKIVHSSSMNAGYRRGTHIVVEEVTMYFGFRFQEKDMARTPYPIYHGIVQSFFELSSTDRITAPSSRQCRKGVQAWS
jgi:hypothetical protein